MESNITTAEKKFWRVDVLHTDEYTEWKAVFLEDGDGNDSEVLSIHCEGDTVVFTEQRDSWHDLRLTKPQAIAALKQAIEWIEKSC